jgi:hypothetical protein
MKPSPTRPPLAGFVGHHHVDRIVGAEKVLHAHHVRMDDARQRPALFEKALQANAEHRQVGLGNAGREFARLAQREGAGQVFLDRDRVAVPVIC